MSNQIPTLVTARLDNLKELILTTLGKVGNTEIDATRAESARDLTLGYKDDVAVDRAVVAALAADVGANTVYQNMAGIDETVAATGFDAVWFGSSLDSDPTWPTRCKTHAWYNEPLGTTTRGTQREYPSLGIAVLEETKLTLYSLDTGSLEMWGIYEEFTGNTNFTCFWRANAVPKSLTIKNGLILFCGVSTASSRRGLLYIDLAKDTYGRITSNKDVSGGCGIGASTGTKEDDLPMRNDIEFPSSYYNDTAIKIDDDAPIDFTTGLPVPTIAVATNDGGSVVNNDRTVSTGGTAIKYTSVAFNENGDLFFGAGISTVHQVRYTRYPLWKSNGFIQDSYRSDASPALIENGNTQAIAAGGNALIVGQSKGLTIVHENPSDPASSGSTRITTDSNTGIVWGDIKACWLAGTTSGTLPNGSTLPDYSHNQKPLTVVGSPTLSPIATGSELMALGGLSTTDYVEATDVSFTSSLYVYGWVKAGGVWEFKHGPITAPNIEGLTFTGNTIKIAGTSDKALIRVTDIAPTPAQVQYAYNQERPMFQPDTKIAVHGTSNDIVAVSEDTVTGLRHIGTSSGMTTIQGIVPIEHDDVPVTTFIHAHNGAIARQ